ncbi:hypothetical protein [Prochlorococcus marinus]|uniref:Uncharacterized protein n=1 Tax=Prochlorococcus marinus (strain MIT 9211) TaxID=93059 RepID=A9BE73_PROM4|nr:hypothetical protein [Prochlorococcus marinus]ABX08383.1 Hypothetical protein P9211_04521 [Prochlorococcus marinus str. MIT 9211]
MKSFLTTGRSKWIFAIGLIAIGAGFTAKHVTSYPHECLPSKSLEISILPQSLP